MDRYQGADGSASQEACNQSDRAIVVSEIKTEGLRRRAWVILGSADSVPNAGAGSCKNE